MGIKIVLFGELSSGLWGCFTAEGTGALHKIDGFMRKEIHADILKQHLKTSVRKLKLGCKWTMTPSILPKLWHIVHILKIKW